MAPPLDNPAGGSGRRITNRSQENTSKNGIFGLADKFGYESPFEDWLPGNKNPEDEARIVEMHVSKNIAVSQLGSEKNPARTTVPVVVRLTIQGAADRVEVTCNDTQKQTAVKKAGTGGYEAYFNLSITKSYALKEEYNSKDFIFTASVIDIFQEKSKDIRSVKITLDIHGKIASSLVSEDINSKIKIVIDPGHGYTRGNTGAVSYIYKHKIRGQEGNPVLEANGDFKTESSNIIKLPQYVIEEPNAWIISKKEDPDHNERNLVFDISMQLRNLLDKDDYICFITRESRVINGNDDSNTRNKRVTLANDNQADYFISIHADGADNNISSGAHVIYPKTSDKKLSTNCKTLGIDILRFYNIVQVESSSPKEDVRGLQVLNSSNKTQRKVLVELGFVTTPRDAKAMFSNIEKIASQLYQGLLYNINNNF